MLVKICGITERPHAFWAAHEGADMLGFVFAESPRKIDPEEAKKIISYLPAGVKKVGVFVNEDLQQVNDITSYCRLDFVQLHGNESPDYCGRAAGRVIKAFRIKDCDGLAQLADYQKTVELFLLDTYVGGIAGGTGKTFDWALADEAKTFGKIILAGGLTPKNISSAISKAKPFGIDVSTGVETGGSKDLAKISAFISNARGSENV